MRIYFSSIFRVLILRIALVSLGIIASLYCFLPTYAHTAVPIEVKQGDSLHAVGIMLYDHGLIRSVPFFIFYAAITRRETMIKPGIYTFSGFTTPEEILSHMSSVQGAVKITIHEGATVRDVDTLLADNAIIERGSLIAFMPRGTLRDHLRSYGFSSFTSSYELEGFLFPDTYWFQKNEGVDAVVETMVDNFDTKAGPLLQPLSPPERFRMLIVASLIEKEVANVYDRSIVSGIIWKRLSTGVPLQIDASVHYGVCVTSTQCPRALRHSDLLIDTPFNGYLHKGLPPTPIANSGISALYAALHPQQSPYWYYLSAPDGTTFFSKTLEEHSTLRARYLSL